MDGSIEESPVGWDYKATQRPPTPPKWAKGLGEGVRPPTQGFGAPPPETSSLQSPTAGGVGDTAALMREMQVSSRLPPSPPSTTPLQLADRHGCLLMCTGWPAADGGGSGASTRPRPAPSSGTCTRSWPRCTPPVRRCNGVLEAGNAFRVFFSCANGDRSREWHEYSNSARQEPERRRGAQRS